VIICARTHLLKTLQLRLFVAWSPSAADPNTGKSLIPGNAYNLGTSAEILMPVLKCDPRNGGGDHFNTACFSTPTVLGQNGQAVWPYIKGPAFINTDLGVFKTFRIAESQNIQFRASAFNFINHALPQFGLGNDIKLQMGCNSVSANNAQPTCDGGGGSNSSLQTTGTPQYETGRRVVEVALKYNF
jgi:hypothetical protein